MEFEDFFAPEVAIATAVTAALCSPRVRKVLRRGAVYGVAGVLIAGDAVTSFARNVGHGFQEARISATQKAEHATNRARAQSVGGQ